MEYTYSSWLHNKFEYSKSLEPEIPKPELKKIKQHQLKLFTTLWKEKLVEYKERFDENYENSLEKEDCFKTEWSYIIAFLNSDKKLVSNFISHVLPIHTPDPDIDVIREIIAREIRGGKVYLANIKSPGKIDDKSLTGYIDRGYDLRMQIQAHAFYHFYKYLENFKKENFEEIKVKKTKKEITIWNKEYEEQLSQFHTLLIQSELINPIAYHLFKNHFYGNTPQELIHWTESIPSLISLLDEIPKKYLNTAALISKNSVTQIHNNSVIAPQLISNHFSYCNKANNIVSIRPNDISKIRHRSSSYLKPYLKKIIASL